VRKRIAEGDKYAEIILNAMIHQIKKEIGAMCAVLDGDVDAIILTAGVSYDNILVESIRKSLNFVAPVIQVNSVIFVETAIGRLYSISCNLYRGLTMLSS
jgi:butyrate kinase